MAAYNKVVYGKKTLVDMTGDTATAAEILSGYTAHIKTGAKVTGTYVVGKPDSKTVTFNDDFTITDGTDTVTQNSDGSITRTQANGNVITTAFTSDTVITKTCKNKSGTTIWTEKHTFNSDGTVTVTVT